MQLVNTAIGIALIYGAILHPASVVEQRWAGVALAAGLVVSVLALMSRRSTAEPWQANVVIVLGFALMFQAVLRWLLALSAVVDVWFVFWIGIFTAILSLWAMLYHPEAGGAVEADLS